MAFMRAPDCGAYKYVPADIESKLELEHRSVRDVAPTLSKAIIRMPRALARCHDRCLTEDESSGS